MNQPVILENPRGRLATEKLKSFIKNNERLKNHFLFQTSGTSGQSKWVALSADALEVSAKACNDHLQVTTKDIFALCLPTFHVGGYGILERARVAGAKLVKRSEERMRWDAKDFKFWIEQTRATISSLVPAQIYDLVKSSIVAPPTLRAIVVGGGNMPESLYRAARQLSWPVLPSYGLTECSSQVATATLESLDKKNHDKTVYPPAKILSHIEAKQVGEFDVSIRSRALLSYYVIEEEAQVSIMEAQKDGFFLLPDKIQLNSDEVKVFGRKEEFKVLGEWIRWDLLQNRFYEMAFKHGLFQKVEILLLPHDRLGNALSLICEDFDKAVDAFVKDFNLEVFPFERLTHYVQAKIPRTQLGKFLKSQVPEKNILKEINSICLQ